MTCPACARLGQINRALSADLDAALARATAAEADRDRYRAALAEHGNGRLVPRGPLGPRPGSEHYHQGDPPPARPAAPAPLATPRPRPDITTGPSARAIAHRRRRALIAFLSNGPRSRQDLLDHLGITGQALHSLCQRLLAEGSLTITRHPTARRTTVYQICL